MGKTALLFAGQGAQAVGMGADFYETSPAARAVFDMGEKIAPGITALTFHGDAAELAKTENTQPCLFLTDLAIAAALRKNGLCPGAVAGFSLGELPALAFSGLLTEEDAFRLVLLRGQTMAKLSGEHPGAMAAVLKLDAPTVEGICGQFTEIWPVNYNCPGQISCAGSKEQMDDFCAAVKTAGGRAVKLAVSGAFHTPYMAGAVSVLEERLKTLTPGTASVPVYANRTAAPYAADGSDLTETLSRQVASPVRFEQTLRTLWNEGFDTFVEAGAGATLSGFVRRTLPEATVFTVNSAAGLEEWKNAWTQSGETVSKH